MLSRAELKALLEKRAELMCKKYGPDFESDFLAGHRSTHDIICELTTALELCHRRMKFTAWVEDECFEKAEDALSKLRTELGEA